MNIDINNADIKIPFAISFLSGILFLISGAMYSMTGATTGYVLILVGIIVLMSAMRMKTGQINDVKDPSLAVIFFGILNVISFIFILSGFSVMDLPFISGFMASILAIVGGYLGFSYARRSNS